MRRIKESPSLIVVVVVKNKRNTRETEEGIGQRFKIVQVISEV